MDKIVVNKLYKIFGKNPQRVFRLLKDGKTKDEIYKKTGCTLGVNNASFSVKAGEIFVIMGLSGSGKSTLVRCLNRLIAPTSGEILLNGEDIMKVNKNQLREIRRNKFAMVFQHFGLLPHRSVINNVAFGLEIQAVSKAERFASAEKAIELVGLAGMENANINSLSGGMQQRVGLARAIAADPEILLMDEAFSALDPLLRTNMQDELLELQAQMKKTIIFISHDLDEALKIGDRIAIMKDGIIEQIDTPEQILINPASDYIRSFIENVDRSKVITARTVMHMPDVIASHKDGPAQAVRHMKKTGLSTLFVVDENRQLVGVVRIDDAVKLAANHGNSSLLEIINKDVPTTTAETPLVDLLQNASETAIPIVVLNDKGHVKGIVTRASILAALAGEDLN